MGPAMYKYFIKKTWGFDSLTHPILGFDTDKGRGRFLKESNTEDWVLIVGTGNDFTPECQRKRLLAKIRLGRNTVDSEQVLLQVGKSISPEERDADGNYKWPHGLPMIEAHVFDGSPLLVDVFGHNLTRHNWNYVSDAWDMSKDDDMPENIVDIIESLPTTKVEIARIPELKKAEYKTLFQELQKNTSSYGNTGPAPKEGAVEFNFKKGVPVTYVLELKKREREGESEVLRSVQHSESGESLGYLDRDKFVFKVGSSNDLKNRIKSLNRALMTEVTGYQWVYKTSFRLDTDRSAFAFEQITHTDLKAYLIKGRREEYMVSFDHLIQRMRLLGYPAEFMSPEVQGSYEALYQESLEGA